MAQRPGRNSALKRFERGMGGRGNLIARPNAFCAQRSPFPSSQTDPKDKLFQRSPPKSEERQVPSPARLAEELDRTPHAGLAPRHESLYSPPAEEGRGGRLAAEAGGLPLPPVPASPTYYSRFAKEVSSLCRDLYGPTPAWDQRGDAISSRVATSGGESETRRPPLRMPFAGRDSAASGPRLQPGARVPAKTPPLAPRDRI